MMLYPAIKRAGIKREPRSYGFHLFRHTAGSIVHDLTSDLKTEPGELLAQSHISTTAVLVRSQASLSPSRLGRRPVVLHPLKSQSTRRRRSPFDWSWHSE